MKKKNVRYAVQIGCDISSSLEAIALSKKYPEIFFATVGFHPCEAMNMDPDPKKIEELEKILQKNRKNIVAIGECGLDFHYLDGTDGGKIPFDEKNASEKAKKQIENQKFWWRQQAKLAKKYNLPLVIHTRDAQELTLEMIFSDKMDFLVMHCYSENWEMAQKLLDFSSRIYFSFSGIVTYKKSVAVQEAAKKIPLNRILVETDAPYLAPQNYRGKLNEPAFVAENLQKIIDLRDEDSEYITKTIFENSKRFYGI